MKITLKNKSEKKYMEWIVYSYMKVLGEEKLSLNTWKAIAELNGLVLENYRGKCTCSDEKSKCNYCA